jgi:hypothetical protein
MRDCRKFVEQNDESEMIYADDRPVAKSTADLRLFAQAMRQEKRDEDDPLSMCCHWLN